jgi:DNA invertase Pin-like site-specific DNA recombinase
MASKVAPVRMRRKATAVKERVPALGYASLPEEKARAGTGVQAQELAIDVACDRLGLELLDLVCDDEPDGPEPDPRPGLANVLERMETGEASCLIVSGLEQLSSEVSELASLVDRLERGGVRLIALDVGLDTATPSGRLAMMRRPVGRLPWEPEPEVDEELPREDAEGAFDEAEVIELELVRAEPAEEPAAEEPAVEEPAAEEPAVEEPAAEAPPPPEPVAPVPALDAAIAYASIPSESEADHDLDAQRGLIERGCERYGLRVIEFVGDREPRDGKALDRAGLSHALERIAAGDAACLIVAGLERLSRSVADLGTLVRWLERNGVRLVAIDIDLDTSSPGGRVTARALASVADMERDRLSERTRKGLAAARAKRHAAGDASTDWVALRKRIAGMRADGMTLQAIADVLNEEGVPTQRGGAKWRPSSVQTAAGYRRRTRPKGVEDLPRKRPPST